MNIKSDKNGFTLVEVLLIVAVFVILLAGSVSMLNTRVDSQDITYKAKQVADLIAKAQNYSISGYRNDVWGIKVLDSNAACADNGDCIVMYKGSTYSNRDASFDQKLDLSGNTGVYLDANQVNEFYFEPSSGWLATTTGTSTNQWIVLKSNFGSQKSVLVDKTGVTSIFTCGDSQMFDDEGHAYNTVKIGSQCWMAENLNMGSMLASVSTNPSDNGTIEKWCYDNSTTNCDTYGGLYNWDELMSYSTTEGARGICPVGWHIPSDAETDTMVANYPSVSAGTELKLGGSSGFNLLLAGIRNDASNSFASINDYGRFWTSTQYIGTNAYYDSVRLSLDTVLNGPTDQNYGFSGRCLKDY